jgi:hypothetical protein
LWQINQDQASLEESGLVMETSFLRDVEHSTSASLTFQAPPGGTDPSSGLQAVSFTTTGPENGPDSFDVTTGQPLWQSYVVYFVPAGTRTLYRKVWPVPWLPMNAQQPPALFPGQMPATGQLPYTFPNSAPIPLTDADLQTLCQTRNGTETALGTGLQSLTVALVTGSPQTGQLTIQLGVPSLLGIATSQRLRQFHFWM